MKILAVILSTLFLALNLIPCGDGPHPTSGASEIKEVCPEEGSEKEGPIELCSPFCQQCHCCSVSTTDLLSTELILYNPEISTAIFLHFENPGEEILFSLFQPPRV